MKCEEVRDELVAYVRGELEEARRDAVEEHLVRCGECARESERTRYLLEIMRLADTDSVKDQANRLIKAALERRASDVHLEGCQSAARVRFRIDGVLHEQPDLALTKEQYNPLVARIKRMADMNLTERRVPQDGRIAISHGCTGREYDLRVSVFPYLHGEGVVMRILDRQDVLIGLNRLGFLPEMLARVETLIHQPAGVILVTGPAGAGKTTTLYSMLHERNRPEIKIMTLEDRVEYALDGVNQGAINPDAGLHFTNAVRALLRQDPDILMVGELHDLETISRLFGAGSVGCLAFSVMHSPDPTSAIARLIDVGLAPSGISHSLLGILGQRLVRTVCPDCRTEYHPADADLAVLGFTADSRPASFQRGQGCDRCRQSGYRGRTGLFELLTINRELAQMIVERAAEPALRARALETGCLWPFAADARAKVAQGTTTAEEVARVLPELCISGAG
jgi:type IV pilus assembly protein PilB